MSFASIKDYIYIKYNNTRQVKLTCLVLSLSPYSISHYRRMRHIGMIKLVLATSL